MSAERPEPPQPPQAPDSVQVMDTGEQPFLTRSARRAAREAQESRPDAELPPIAHVPRVLTVLTTILGATFVAVSASAGDMILAIALLLGLLVVAWGWPRAAGLPSPRGSSGVLALTAILLVGAVLAVERAPYLRWTAAALAIGLVAMFVQQLLRRDGRPRLVEAVMGTGFGLVILASGVSYLPVVHVVDGPQLIGCAMAAIAGGTVADLVVRNALVRPWLLPLSMVAGGVASVGLSLVVGSPDLPPAALVGVTCAALSHAFRRLLSPEAGSFSSQGQIATGVASVAVCGPLLWAIFQLVVR
jgi:hypothetical protein